MFSSFLYNLYIIKFNNFVLINFFNKNLLFLNKLQLNYLIIVTMTLFSFSLYNYNKLMQIILLFIKFYIKKKKIYFIKLFINGMFKIHPILFYFIVIHTVYNLFNKFSVYKFVIKYLLNITIITLLLGSIWALFELKWGYYWSNDSIELNLLLIVLLYTTTIHMLYKNSKFKLYQILIIINLLLLIRGGYMYTKHNFFNVKSVIVHQLKLNLPLLIVNNIILKKINTHKTNYLSENKILQTAIFSIFCLMYLNYLNYLIIKKIINLSIKFSIVYTLIIVWLYKLEKKLYHVLIVIILLLMQLINLKYIINIKTMLTTQTLSKKNIVTPLYMIDKKINYVKFKFYVKNLNYFYYKNINKYLINLIS